MEYYWTVKENKIIEIAGKRMEREIIVTGNTDSERQTVIGFFSFIDASLEFLDICILLGMPIDIRKLVKIHEKLKRREREDGRQWREELKQH